MESAEDDLYGRQMASTFCGPSASQAKANETAESIPPERLITAREKPARLTSERIKPVRIFLTRPVSMERLFSMQDPFQFAAHQLRAFVPQQGQAGARTVQVVQIDLGNRQGFF